MNFRKKFVLTLMVFVTGTVIAFTTDASLGEYTMFAATILATFGAADVADKKFNGGVYDERQGYREAGTGADRRVW